MKGFIIFLFLFMSGGIIVTLDYADYFYPLFVGTLLVSMFPKLRKLKLHKKALGEVLLFMVFFAVLIPIRGEPINFSNNLIILTKLAVTLIFIVYLHLVYLSVTEFFDQFVAVAEKLILLSLVTFVVGNITNSLTLNVTDDTRSIAGIAFYRIADLNKFGFIRNQGIFWEPGVLGVVIILAYIVKTMFLSSKKNLWLYYTGVLSTFSFGAIIIFSLLFFSTSIMDLKRRNPTAFFIILLPVVSLVFLSGLYPVESLTIVGKLLGRDFTTDTSASTRFIDLYYGVRSGLNAMWFGNGADFSNFYSLTLEELNKSKKSYEGGLTNSIVALFYCYGIFFFAFYLTRLWMFSMSFTKEKRLFVFVALIGVLMLEPLSFSLLFLFVVNSISFVNLQRK